MAATRYRQLVAPSLVDTTPLETGNSEAAAELAHAFKSFEGVATTTLGKLRANQGEEEGAIAGASGKPEFRGPLRALTAYGQAYNNAAMRSYAIKAEADAEDNAARLEVEAANDPEKFATLFGSFRDETIKQAPKEARGTLSMIYAQRMGTGVARLTRARAVEQQNIARADTVEGVERSVDRIANLNVEDDPASYEQSLEEEAKLGLMIDGAVNDGTLTATEGQALHKKAQRQIFSQTVSARFRAVLNSPTGSPVDFIEKLRAENAKSEVLSPSEEEAMVDKLIGDLREHNALMNMKYSEDNSFMKERYEAGNREATAALFTGELTTAKLTQMVREQRLDPDRATTLHNELTSPDRNIDDSKEALRVSTHLNEYTEEEIAENKLLSYKTRRELILKKQDEAQTWKSTQQAQEGEARIKRALGIVPGTNRAMLSDEENEALDQALNTWYNEIDALPPGERQLKVISVAEDVAGRFIRKNKSVQAQQARRNKEAYMQREGDPAKMGEEELKAYKDNIARWDANIAELEAEAARK
jgi:hypothetical protein